MDPQQPHQPLVDVDGVTRFKKNAIVEHLLDTSTSDMNDLALMPFSNEDRVQFAELIGYSLSGFGELSYVSDVAYGQVADAARSRVRRRLWSGLHSLASGALAASLTVRALQVYLQDGDALYLGAVSSLAIVNVVLWFLAARER